jgi:hypothetical protein
MTLVQRNGKYYTEYMVKSTDTGLMQIAKDNPLPANHTWKEIIKAENDKWAPLDAANKWTIHPKQKLLLPADPPVSPPASSDFDGQITVIASWGVNIRDQGDHQKGSYIGIPQESTKGKTYNYKKNSVTKRDAHQRVWVEVSLTPPVNGHSTGWLPVNGPQDAMHNTGPIEDWVSPHIDS